MIWHLGDSWRIVVAHVKHRCICRPVALCLVCLCPVWAAAAEIATEDGLALVFGAEGEVTYCRIDGREGCCGPVRSAASSLPMWHSDREDLIAENLGFRHQAGDLWAGRGPDWQPDRRLLIPAPVS